MSRHVVELFGVPRQLAGAGEVEIDLPPEGTLRDAAAELGRVVPALVGRVLTPDGGALIEPYVFNLNGRHFAAGLDVRPAAGDRIVLMQMAAGG